MKETGVSLWLFNVWFIILLSSCNQSMDNRAVIKELREIKQEIKNAK